MRRQQLSSVFEGDLVTREQGGKNFPTSSQLENKVEIQKTSRKCENKINAMKIICK